MRRSEFQRDGLGYRMAFPEVAMTFSVDRLRVSSGDVKGHVMVRSEMAGAQTYADRVVHYSQETLSSSTARKTLGRILCEKIPTDPQIDWGSMYDEFCTTVMLSDRAGADPDVVGRMAESAVHGLLLEPLVPLGVHSILFGPGGLGKSILATAIAVSVQTGREIVPGLLPLVRGPVLYLNWETNREDIDARVKAVCRGAGIAPVEMFHLSGGGRPLAQRLDHVARVIDKTGAVMMVVDSNGKAIGTSGEGPIEDAANRFASALDELNRTALCIDHISKAASDGSGPRNPYGSVMKSNWARATWEMTQSQPPADGETHLVLHHRKHNTTAEHEPIGLLMRWDGGAVTWEAEDVSGATSGLSYGTSLIDQIAATLVEHPLRPIEIAKKTGISDNMVRAMLSKTKARFARLPTGDWTLV